MHAQITMFCKSVLVTIVFCCGGASTQWDPGARNCQESDRQNLKEKQINYVKLIWFQKQACFGGGSQTLPNATPQ